MPRPPLSNVTLNPQTGSGFVYSPTPSAAGSKKDGESPGEATPTPRSELLIRKTRTSQRPALGGPAVPVAEPEQQRVPSVAVKEDKKSRRPSLGKRSSSFTRVKSWGHDIGDVAAGVGLGRWSSSRSREKEKSKGDRPKSVAQRGIFGRVLGSWARDIDDENGAASDTDGDSVYTSSNSEIDTTDSESDADRSISYAQARRITRPSTRQNSHSTGQTAIQGPSRLGTTTPDKEFNAWRVSTPTTPRASTRPTTSSSASVFKVPPPPLDIKRGRPPSLRLALEICCTVSGADVRGGQEAWCSVSFRGEIDDGDWDVQNCEGGIDVAVVLDISSFSSPAAFERMRDNTIKLLTSLRPETDNIALITVRSRHRRQQNDTSPCETVHFMSPCTPTIIRHLCSVAGSLRASGSPKTIVREVDYLEAVERAAGVFSKKQVKGRQNARHVILMTARQPTFDMSSRGTAGVPEGDEISVHERIQLHVVSTSQLLYPETKIPPHPLVPGYIVPPTGSVLDIIPYMRLDLYITPYSQITVTLTPPTPTHGPQSLSLLSPFESHVLLTHLKIPPAPTGGQRRDISGSSTTSDYSTLERHLEATLGQLLTPILDVSAYYNPHTNSPTRAAVRRTLRIRRFFSGSDTGVWAEIDRQDFASEESHKVTRGLAIAMGNRGEEYGGEEDINEEVRYLSSLRSRFNGSGSSGSSTTESDAASLFDEKASVRLGSDFRDDATDEAGRIWNEIRREIRRPSTTVERERERDDADSLGGRTEQESELPPSGITSQTGTGWEKFGPWGV